MAKTDPTKPATEPTTTEQTTTAAANVAAPRPRLGDTVNVRVAKDTHLINSETGTYFTPEVATPQAVTVTTLRRLDDGDFVLV